MVPMSRPSQKLVIGVILFWGLMSGVDLEAGCEKSLSKGESVYVPIYSNVYSGPKASAFELAVMLSIRNIDPKHSITIVKAEYHDSSGKNLESYVQKPTEVKPMASTYFYIKEYDKRGGPGASFLVKWSSEHRVNMPIIEGIMLGLSSGQGVSFVCPGRIITEPKD
jgi:hypothetical protein